jgi:hypothetical protein
MYISNNSKLIIIILTLSIVFTSCIDRKQIDGKNNSTKDKQEQKTKLSKEEEFKENFPSLELVSFTSSILIVKGSYDYTRDISSDIHIINNDVWKLANKYTDAKTLKINILLKSMNKYGETKITDLGYCEIKNLNEVRKYKGPEFYGRDALSGGEEVFDCLYGRKNSPYYVRN